MYELIATHRNKDKNVKGVVTQRLIERITDVFRCWCYKELQMRMVG